MKVAIYTLMIAFMVWGCMSCDRHQERTEAYAEADSLNHVAYDMRYKNLSTAIQAASRACRLSEGNADLHAEALNNMGFCTFMRMNFEESASLFRQALKEGNNEIEHLISDIGLMKICQRTSMNKEFYDYRNSALRRLKRIREDEALISDAHEKMRLNYAISEFHIVSGIYFYYLEQRKESLQSINSITPEVLKNDTAQSLYYEYMRGSGGMYEAPTREQVITGEFGCLTNCLVQSRKGGYIYFEANALQAMAELLNFRSNREILEKHHSGALRLVNENDLPIDSLPIYYAREALKLFKEYGDGYQISGTYRTIATYYNYSGHPEKALENLKEALQYVNWHHEKYYHCTDTTDRLRVYAPGAIHATELKWIADEGIKTIPEWILRLREQLSRTYAAMGCKAESDYNRNAYLDLLDYTRQDKALESRYMALEKESRQLNALLSLVVIGIFVLIVLFIVLSRYWRKRNKQYISILKKVFDLCRKITSSVPAYVTETDEIVDALCQAVKNDFFQIFGATDVKIVLDSESADGQSEETPVGFCEYELCSPDKKKKVGKLLLALPAPLRKEKYTLLQLVLPYLAWTVENGLNLVSLDDERRRLEKEQYIHEQHLAENKRQNMVKKACLSIVTGILPYIDRVINEVHKLQSAAYARRADVKKGKFEYIDELITRINEYNEILALWIKMRQGVLSLNIENFALKELFDIIAKGRRSFEMKHQELIVSPTEAVVKADKALTLFMINTLSENARKYTPEHGRVELSAVETDDYVEISVSDNGPGLSEEDVNRILGEKVYDSGSIGMGTAADTEELRKQKGSGFGLMNCKGIIEKYRKTNAVFRVCCFSIDSTLGKGSRFYFRLPKGVKKMFSICLLLIAGLTGLGSCQPSEQQTAKAQNNVFVYDSLLTVANSYANLVYDCNVNGRYQEALVYADSVLRYMNLHYLKYSKRRYPLLKLYRDDYEAAEQTWLAQGFNTDYYILLDVRNEAAVAGLAVKDFRTYYYNNRAYATLYKQVSKDRSLEEYCVRMQQSANNKLIALGIFVLLVVACLAGYYILYLRHRLHYRYNMEQVFEINQSIFSVAQPQEEEETSLAESILAKLSDEMNELVPVAAMTLALYDEETAALHYVAGAEGEEEEVYNRIQRCFEKKQVMWTDEAAWNYFPLNVEVGEESYCAGVLAIKTALPCVREDDRLLVELVVSYLAVVLHHTVVCVRRKHYDIELAQDEARRTSYEENMLHVQNMVLDNCLSTIKHETIYYPNRIKQIVDRLNREETISLQEEQQQLQTISELVGYYKDIFTLLSSCASRQLDEITFRRTDVQVSTIVGQAEKYLRKITRKLSYTLSLETEIHTPLTVSGDNLLLIFLFENLLDEAVRYPQAGTLKLAVYEENGFARFDFTDTRRSHTQEELNDLFYPVLSHFQAEGGTGLQGTEFLVCKQIVREHDEFAGRRGCRINACPCAGGGYTVWFTIPLSTKK